MTKLWLGLVAVLAVTGAAQAADDSAAGLAAVKAYMLQHAAAMRGKATTLSEQAKGYYDLVQAEHGDYAALAQKDGAGAATLIGAMKQTWIETHNNYEQVEGIVAGVPALSNFDLVIDAGVPEAEGPDGVSPLDITLPDGTVLKHPGNLLHYNLETTLWTTRPEVLKGRVQSGGTETTLPDANRLLGSALALKGWTGQMEASIEAWQPSLDDAFTALVTMVPTAGDYFGEWKESRFVGGTLPIYVAQSRLVDVQGIMGSTQLMYARGAAPAVAAADPALDRQIQSGFKELLSFIGGVRVREDKGEIFKPEEADAIGNEAGERAERITAQVALAAKKLNVKVPI